MPENIPKLQDLYQRFITDTATPDEVREFWALWQQHAEEDAVREMIFHSYQEPPPAHAPANNWAAATLTLQTHLARKDTAISVPIRRYYPWIAAAAIVLLLAGIWYLTPHTLSKKNTITLAARQDIAPGHNGAVLTLSDGSSILLDSAHNGQVAIQGGAHITKANGVLQYQAQADKVAVVYNTMSTPRGRQFQLVLPDGTRVWLNAASSITYPSGFTGSDRRVTVRGEAYFEVAPDTRLPFIVSTEKAMEIEVLGTTFNINAYTDEEGTKTTLLEGAVRIRNGSNAALLAPGQQAQTGTGRTAIAVADHVDTEKVTAWKNGLFNFTDASLEEVMKQLSRWYDLEVVYEKEIPDKQFWGKMSRNVSLSGLLKGLSGTGVHFRIEEGRRLVVMP